MPEFTAICPFSDFPDFAVIRLKYVPNERCIELKSLKLYINSFREIKVFHEHVINIILEDFVKRVAIRLKVEDRGRLSTSAGISELLFGRATLDPRRETGDRRQETGDRRQETGDRRQETGDISL